MIEEYVQLEAVRDYVDESGVYEIVCEENARVYVGQSTSIANRVHKHLSDLANNRHSNSLLQHDWNRLDPGQFVFRMVRSIPYTEIRELVRAERAEIRLRRKHDIQLYNDFRVTGNFEPETEEENEVAYEHELRKAREEKKRLENKERKIDRILNGTKPRRPIRRRTYDEVTCYDCGASGGLNDKHFKCPDKMVRCESCIDDYLGKENKWLATKELAPRKMSTTCMRWQMFSDNFKRELKQAITAYAQKHRVKPRKILTCGRTVRGGKISGVLVEQGEYVPKGYLDMPIPAENE